MIEVPPKWGLKTYTLAVTRAGPACRWAGQRLVMIHCPRVRSQTYALMILDDEARNVSSWGAMPSIADALLVARERFDVPVRAWRMYGPPRGVRVYSRPRTRADRHNAAARKRLELYIYVARLENRDAIHLDRR